MEDQRVKDIVEKLEILGCTLLGSKQDVWINELLFESGSHRFSLIQWVLLRLGYSITGISGQVTDEEKAKKLLLEVLNLGLCQNSDVIEGKATVKEQIEFWSSLVDLLWLEHEATAESIMPSSIVIKVNDQIVEGDGKLLFSETQANAAEVLKSTSSSISSEMAIQEKFEAAMACISKICRSVSIKHLFQHDFQLLSPYVQTELKDLQPKGKVPSLDDFKEAAQKKPLKFREMYKLLVSGFSLQNENNYISCDLESSESEKFSNTLSKLEDLRFVSSTFQESLQSFYEIYSDLKPYISNVKTENFFDVGPAFKETEPLLESLLEMKNSFLSIKSFTSKLSQIAANLGDLEKESEALLVEENINRILEVSKNDVRKI